MLAKQTKFPSIGYLLGSVATLIVVLAFMGEWNSRISKIEKLSNQSVIYQNNGLPIWVKVAQDLKKDWISERIIKSDLVYTTRNNNFGGIFFQETPNGTKSRNMIRWFLLPVWYPNARYHTDERVKILQSVFADRHYANERLWSGDNLTTAYIVSDVDIYPSLRLAYTEKYLSIRNNTCPKRGAAILRKPFILFSYRRVQLLLHFHFGLMERKKKEFLLRNKKPRMLIRR